MVASMAAHPRLRQRLHLSIQFRGRRQNRPLLVDPATRVFYAIADRLLVNVEPDAIHISLEEPPWLFSESTSPLSSAFCTPPAPRSTYIQTIQDHRRDRMVGGGRLSHMRPLAALALALLSCTAAFSQKTLTAPRKRPDRNTELCIRCDLFRRRSRQWTGLPSCHQLSIGIRP